MGWPRIRRRAKLKPPNRTSALPTALSAVLLQSGTLQEHAKRSRTEACDIALRTKKIVDLIADAVPDPSEIPPSMLLSIDRFTFALDEIRMRHGGY
ncbi:hypothetical protein C8J57DRAFT_1534749 [Mycena rebaudengoi]|nr:hypothetical protein C8J57DRAFT_1534749 [Mycena rebaudengoi]